MTLRDPWRTETSVGLEILSNRVLNVLSVDRLSLNSQQQTILKEALAFLARAERGRDSVTSLRLGATASEDLNAAVWAVKVGTGAAVKASETKLHRYLEKLTSSLVNAIDSGTVVAEDQDVTSLTSFFHELRQLVAEDNMKPPDIVHVS